MKTKTTTIAGRVATAMGFMIISAFGLRAQTVLAKWEFFGLGGATTVGAYFNVSGVDNSNLKTTFGSGFTATNYNGNGFTARNQTAISLSEALADNDYFAFKIKPSAGKKLTVSKIVIRPVSQSRTRTFVIFSSKSGFNAGNQIAVFTATSGLNGEIKTVTLPGQNDLDAETEFRFYVYGHNNQYEGVGAGNGDGDDIIVEGSVADATSPFRVPENPSGVVNGLSYKYVEGSWSSLPDFNILTPIKTGTGGSFDLSVRNRDDNFALEFSGFIEVPSTGNYTFFTTSDDGSKLYIGSTEVVNNDGLHGSQERAGSIGLQAGKHAIRVTYFEATGGQNLAVSYSTTGINKSIVPASALFRLPSATPPPTSRRNEIAVNLNGSLMDFNPTKPLTDAMLTHREWERIMPNGSINGKATLDTNYWPVEDAKCLVYAGLSTGDNYGTYSLTFTGRANVTSPHGTVNNYVYNSITGISTAKIVITNTNNADFFIEFRNTNGGIKNVKLMRPTFPGSTESFNPSQMFNPVFLNAIQPFGMLRYMDWTATNFNGDSLWSDRTRMYHARWKPPTQPGRTYGWQGRGAPWETVIILSNLLGKDAHISIPHKATDDYIRNLARLFRDGNQYTPGLRSDLKLYVEYSNEIWNWAFSQTGWALKKALTIPAPLNFDGIFTDANGISKDDSTTIWLRYKANRTVEISNIFRQEFGDGQMMTRVRPVLHYQQGSLNSQGKMLYFLENYYSKAHPASNVTTPRPINYFIYAGGGSTYFYPQDAPDLTLDNIWNRRDFDSEIWLGKLRQDAFITKMYGMELLSYEGNTHNINKRVADSVLRIADDDPRMYDEFLEKQRAWNSIDGGINAYFTLVTNSFYALLRNINNLNTPKYNALMEMINTTPQPVTFGLKAPFSTVAGAFFKRAPEWNNPSNAPIDLSGTSKEWAGYPFTTSNVGNHYLQIVYSTTSAATIEVMLSGQVITVLSVPNTSNVATTISGIPLLALTTNKLYVLRIKAGVSTLKLRNVAVTQNSGGRAESSDWETAMDGSKPEINLYPNPATGQVTLEVTGKNENLVTFSNIEGKIISTQIFSPGKHHVDISGFSQGVYLVKFSSGSSVVFKKLIVQ